jgi:hypothetical protein
MAARWTKMISLVAAVDGDQGGRPSTWLRQVSLTPLAFRRLSLAVALGPDEMAYTEEGRIP